MHLNVVILAAGLGKRMHSNIPKVLHRLAGKALLEHVVQTLQDLNPDIVPFIIYSHVGEEVQQTLSYLKAKWVLQAEQLGTGHALLQALPYLSDDPVLVLSGDVPLISVDTLQHFIKNTPADALGMITCQLENPQNLGRILRDKNDNIIGIVEVRDASESQLKIREINSGMYLFPSQFLKKYLPQLKTSNKQREYYLTDIIEFCVDDRIPIYTVQPKAYQEIWGINNCSELARAERYYQSRCAEKLMQQGVVFYDPSRFDLRGELIVGRDVIIDVNVLIEGKVKIGNNCHIGSNTVLRNVTLGDEVIIEPNSVIDGANIADKCKIGPFSRIRPETTLAANTHVGNFVEIKNSEVDSGSKINHLAYVGDSDIGKNVNIGAGTITCNYDGQYKHRTIIGDEAFIGSNTALVAPVEIGSHATIGAGSTITENAPPDKLTLGRAHQVTIKRWKKSKKS